MAEEKKARSKAPKGKGPEKRNTKTKKSEARSSKGDAMRAKRGGEVATRKGSAASKKATANKRADSTKRASSGKKTRMEKLKIIPLGGLDGIGKNMTVFEYGDDMVVVDAGMMFPDDDYPGIDLLIPDYTYILENSHKLRGLIITHGHEDHTGAIPYVLKDLDRQTTIFGTKLTLGLIEGKLDEHHFHDVGLQEIAAGQSIKLGSFTCEFFSVNHSIPAAVGVFLQTPAGNVLHTGDFKLDQTPIDGVRTDFGAMARFAQVGVDLLMSDSTNANVPAFTKSEAEVGKVLNEIIGSAKKRVVVASFASHIHRIQQICDATVAAHRKVAVTGRSMLTNTRIARELGYLDINADDIVDSYEVKDMPRDRLVVLCTGSQGEPLSALTRIANGEHRTIDIEEGDTVIISASPVPGNEKAVNRVKNALSKVGVDFYDKYRATVHVSGHAGMEELKLVMSICKPRNFMPVHGEAQHLQAHADLAESMGIPRSHIFILDNGNTLEMRNGKVTEGEPVESGVVFVEGLSVGDVSALVLKDRKTLGDEGMVTIVMMVSKRDGRPLKDIEVIMRGVTGGDDAVLVDDATAVVQEVLGRSAKDYRINPASLRREVRDELSKFLWSRCRRRPMIIPILMEV